VKVISQVPSFCTRWYFLYAIFSIIGSDSNIFGVFRYFNIDSKKKNFAHGSDYFFDTPKNIPIFFKFHIHFA